jgi:thiol-disulfide isomerase/thioredoxin
VYNELTSRSLSGPAGGGRIRVYLDRECIKPGRPWRQQFVEGLTHSLVFVPIISRGALLNIASTAGAAHGTAEELKSEEYSFEKRLHAEDPSEGAADNVLLEWQLACALSQMSGSRYGLTCRRIVPLLRGEPIKKPIVLGESETYLVGHRPLAEQLIIGTAPSGTHHYPVGVSRSGDPKHSNDDDGYFGQHEVVSHRTIIRRLFEDDAQDSQVVDAACGITPSLAVRHLFDVQKPKHLDEGVEWPLDAANLMAEVTRGVTEVGTMKSIELGQLDAVEAEHGALEMNLQDAVGSEAAKQRTKEYRQRIRHSTTDALGLLAKRFADEIVRVVDECFKEQPLSGSIRLPPLGRTFSFSDLLGPKLQQCGRGNGAAALLRTEDELQDVDGAVVVLCFCDSTTAEGMKAARKLKLAFDRRLRASDGQPPMHVVYIPSESSESAFARFSSRNARGWFAVPYRSASIGDRARRFYKVQTLPSMVITQWVAASPHSTESLDDDDAGGVTAATRVTTSGAGKSAMPVLSPNLHGEVKRLNQDATSAILADERAEHFPWVEQPVDELLGPTLIRRKADQGGSRQQGLQVPAPRGPAHAHDDAALDAAVRRVYEEHDRPVDGGRTLYEERPRRQALEDVEVLAIYFGGEWCPHCVTFKPIVDRAYAALRQAYGPKFEIVYVSSDQDQGAFDHYFGQMDWLALPFTSTELKKKLDERFNVSGVPTVIMLKRETIADGRGDGPFVMLPDGANGRTLLSQPPGKLVADFPWGTEDRIVQPLQAELHAIEQNLSLVVLCEHLTPSQPEYKQTLLPTLEQVARTWARRPEVLDGQWPHFKFLVAHGPPSEPSIWLRSEARLPPFGSPQAEPLEVLIIDDTVPSPLVYSLRALWGVPGSPMPQDRTMSTRSFAEDKGRLLTFFLESWMGRERAGTGAGNVWQTRPVCMPFGDDAGGAWGGLGRRVEEDAATGAGVAVGVY